MTIIAYRNGVLAADSAMFSGDTITYGRTKVFRRNDGTMYGAMGTCSLSDAFHRWVAGGEIGEPVKWDKESEGILIRPSGVITIFDEFGSHECCPEFYADGSGVDFALGAMFMGASAIQAVRAAIKFCATCAGEVHWVSNNPSMLPSAQQLKRTA